jgi:hypothetical protein
MTHETIEEAAKRCFKEMQRLNPKGGLKEFIRMAVNFGAKWQAERMYSDLDVEIIIRKLMDDVHCGDLCYGDNVIDFKMSPRTWFEQFKNQTTL